MKKRIYFIVSSVIQIIFGIYVIITASSIVQSEVEALRQIYEIMHIEMLQDMIETIKNTGENSLIICSVICILINIGIIVTAIKNTILRNKGLLIVANVVCFLFAGSEIVELLTIANIIVLLCLKRTNPEDFPQKKELPVLEKIPITKMEIIIGILLALIYFSQFIWQDFIPDSKIIAWIVIISFYFTVIVLSIAFWNKTIKRDLKAFKNNFGTYLKFILSRMGIMYVIYFVVTIITIIATKSISSANQQNLESLPTWYVIPLAIIYAPIVEETIFRGLIRKLIKNKYVFIIISAICFGLLHTIASEMTLINVIVKALPYTVLGAYLAYVYAKTDNISTNMFAHMLINLVASMLTLL